MCASYMRLSPILYFIFCLSNAPVNNKKQLFTSKSRVISTFFPTYNENLLLSLCFSFIASPIIFKLAFLSGDVVVKPRHLHEEKRLLKRHIYLHP